MSNSYDSVTHNIYVSALISAPASAPKCIVTLVGDADLAAGPKADARTLGFTVTTFDSFGMRIRDVATKSYSATALHSDGSITACKVVYDGVSSDKHAGSCVLPELSGDFTLEVLDSADEVVGDRTYPFSVTKCQSDSYWDADSASCESCGGGYSRSIKCHANSALEDIVVRKGHWRAYATSQINYVRECPNPDSCVGNVTSEGCVGGAAGPLCATCKNGYVQDSSTLECTSCTQKRKMQGKVAIGLLCGSFVLLLVISRKLKSWLNGRGADDKDDAGQVPYAGWERLSEKVGAASDNIKVMVSYAQIVSQQVGGCLVAPWPKAYADFVSQFEVLSVKLMPYLGASCLFPPTNFYTTLTVQTLGPIGVAFLLFAHYKYSVTRASSVDAQRSSSAGNDETARETEEDENGDAQHELKTSKSRTSSKQSSPEAKLAARLLWLSYIVFPGTSQTVLQTFACKYQHPWF